MTRNFIKFFFRFLIIALLAAPLIKPFIEQSIARLPPKTLTLWVDINLPWSASEQAQAETKLRQKFSLDSNIRLNFRRFGSLQQTPIQDYEELIGQLSASTGEQIIVSNANLWGLSARNFQREIRKIASIPTRKILVLSPQDLNIRAPSSTPPRFLALSELSAPQLNFLSEASQLSLEIIGRLNPNESQTLEVIVRSGESLLTSRSLTVTADSSGTVNTVENVPVHFTHAQQQLLTAQISNDLTFAPLNVASTPVSVVHSKSTVLHIGVGPDWSMRNMRMKMKFWPNLDLLSYYILREMTDDMSIPSNQLSLIEFPSEKLFGEQLPNFHGVLAQNFVFDSYLNAQDTQNLFDYVSVSGGRLVIQAGPLSFLGRDSKIKDLFPCENKPEFDLEKPHTWRIGKNRFLSESQFELAIGQIITKQTALGCQPKAGALILAETADDPPSPMILAYPVGKGLVVAILAGDWHTFGSQTEAVSASQRAQRVYAIDASERLFQWMVEFLQRRQDSGLRPPQFAGPRIYRNDPLHLIRSRGGTPEKSILRGVGQSFQGSVGRPLWLAQLSQEAVNWESATKATNAPIGPSFASFPHAEAELARPPSFEPLGLIWQTIGSNENFSQASQNQTQKSLIWPIFEGSMRERERFSNPALFPRELDPASAGWLQSLSRTEEYRESRMIPLLMAYPWLLALALAILALEQLWVRLQPTATLSLVPVPGNKNRPKT